MARHQGRDQQQGRALLSNPGIAKSAGYEQVRLVPTARQLLLIVPGLFRIPSMAAPFS